MNTSRSEKSKKNRKKSKKRNEKSHSESDTSDEWVEATHNVPGNRENAAPKRETWMEMDSCFIPTINRKDLKEKTKITLSVIDQPGQTDRELNPYWKDGGCGLPRQEKEEDETVRGGSSSTPIGDGGVGWLRRAYRRVREQAEEEGKTMQEVAVERFGSLERLEGMLKEAEDRVGSHSRHDRRERFQKPNDHHQSHSSSYHRSSRQSSSHHHRQGHTPKWMKPPKKESPQNESKYPSGNVEEDRIGKPSTITRREPEEVVGEVLSQKEMNVLGAKVVKAELMGDTELAARLKAKLEASRKAGENRGPEVVLLTQSTSGGMARPLEAPADDERPAGRKKQKVATHDKSGQRIRYFGDDDKYSLKKMFEKEKFTTADDETEEFLKMAAKGRTDRDYDFDDLFVDKSAVEESEERRHERAVGRAIREDKYMSSILEKCHSCLESKVMQKHLIIAMGTKSYLSLPSWQSLVEGHCLVVPMGHVAAVTMLDEDVWNEMQVFRKALCQMFRSRGHDTIFIETSMHLRRQPHTYLECLPLPLDEGAMAPMYFKKAILESETEWAQNKKLIDLSKKDTRHSVPKGLPYFAVDFGLQSGFAHVIEDEKLFPKYFGTEIIGGMLDVEPQLWMRPKREKFEEQRKKILQFTQWWTPHDFTSQQKL